MTTEAKTEILQLQAEEPQGLQGRILSCRFQSECGLANTVTLPSDPEL